MSKPRVYIVGAGITGCSLAHFLKDEYEVILYEKSHEIGGLLKTRSNLEGLKYQTGSQILHTNEEWIFKLFQKHLSSMQEIDFKVGIDPLFDFRYYTFPLSTSSIEYLPWHWSEAIQLDLEAVRGHTAPNVAKLLQNFYGQTAYDIFYKELFRKFFQRDPYHIKDIRWVKKQFLRPINNKEKYFNEKFVAFPIGEGYNDLFSEFTESVNVEVNQKINYESIPKDGIIILTTRPDEFFGGNTELEYVKVEFDIDSAIYSDNKPDMMYYANYTPFVSINQFGKQFAGIKNIVSKVYHSLSEGKSAYPVHTLKNIQTYKRLYEAFSKDVVFVGPKATYSFMDISDCVASAAQVVADIKHRRNK